MRWKNHRVTWQVMTSFGDGLAGSLIRAHYNPELEGAQPDVAKWSPAKTLAPIPNTAKLRSKMNNFRYACILLATFTCGLLSAQESGGPPPRNPPTGKPPEKSAIKKTGDVTYDLGGILFNSETREVRVPCSVNMDEGTIEYALVSETGKTHESLLKTKAKPFDLQVSLLLCRYEPHAGEIIKTLFKPGPELNAMAAKPMAKKGANRLVLKLEWKDKDGKAQSAALGDWIHDVSTKKALDIPYWIFSGSDLGDGIFSAELDGSFISVHFDLVGMIGCPANLIGNDQNWDAHTKVIPPVDTPVTLVITPHIEPLKK